MRRHGRILLAFSLFVTPAFLAGQDGIGLDPKLLLQPLSDSWPVYSGDYSGKRFSALTQINRSNVKHLTLAWTTRVIGGRGGRGAISIGGGARPNTPAPLSRARFCR